MANAKRDPEVTSAAGKPVAEPDWQRKRRLAEIFGDVLPETTNDERGPGTAQRRAAESAEDAWLKSQVPPHHGNV